MTAQVDERTVFPPSDSVALDELARLLDGLPTADIVPGVGGRQRCRRCWYKLSTPCVPVGQSHSLPMRSG